MDGYVHPSNGKISNVDCSGNDFPCSNSSNHKPMEALMEQGKIKKIYDNSEGPKKNFGIDIILENGHEIRCYTNSDCSQLNDGDSISFKKIDERTAQSGRVYWNIEVSVFKESGGTLPNQPSNDTDRNIKWGMAFNNATRVACSMPLHGDETPDDRLKLIAELTPKMFEIARSMSTTSKPDDDPLF